MWRRTIAAQVSPPWHSCHMRSFTVLGFSPQLALIHDTRLANAQAQDYDRNRAELRFVRQF